MNVSGENARVVDEYAEVAVVGLDPRGDVGEGIGVREVEARSLGAVALSAQRARLLLRLGLGPRGGDDLAALLTSARDKFRSP